MRTNEPINLMSFRTEAYRRHHGGLARQYRLAMGLVAVLFLATVAAIVTIPPASTVGDAGMTARGSAITLGRS